MPEKPKLPEKSSAGSGSITTILLALMFGLAILFAIAVLLTMVMGPFAIGAIMVTCCVFGFAGFHYLIWGWWLSGIIQRETALEEDDD